MSLKVHNGSAFVEHSIKVRNPANDAWVDVQFGKQWDGTQWVTFYESSQNLGVLPLSYITTSPDGSALWIVMSENFDIYPTDPAEGFSFNYEDAENPALPPMDLAGRGATVIGGNTISVPLDRIYNDYGTATVTYAPGTASGPIRETVGVDYKQLAAFTDVAVTFARKYVLINGGTGVNLFNVANTKYGWTNYFFGNSTPPTVHVDFVVTGVLGGVAATPQQLVGLNVLPPQPSYALRVGGSSWPSGAVLTLKHTATSEGKGGNGSSVGTYGVGFGLTAFGVYGGQAGGGGLVADRPITIDNQGGTFKRGFAGGGAAVVYNSHVESSVAGNWTVIDNVVRLHTGAGGAGRPAGLAGTWDASYTVTDAAYLGTNATLTTGGEGNSPAGGTYGDGGDSTRPAQPGGISQLGSNTQQIESTARLQGYAIQGYDNITWVNQGTIEGPTNATVDALR